MAARSGGRGLPPDDELRQLVDSIPHAVWVTSAAGRTEYINRWGRAFVGLTADDAAGWVPLNCVHPDDSARATAAWEAALGSGQEYALEYRVRDASGGYRWTVASGTPLRDAQGRPRTWVGTWTDVDDFRRQAAEIVALLDALEATAPVALAFVDKESRIVRTNPVMARLNGSSVERMVGRTVEEVLPNEWEHLEPYYRRVLEQGELLSDLEVTRRTADGEASHWLASAYPVRMGEEIVGTGVVGLDVTQRYHADSLREVVLDSMGEGLCALDADGCVTLMNQAAEHMLGWNASDLVGQRLDSIVQPQRADGSPHPEGESQILSVLRTGQTVTVPQASFTRKDGTRLAVAYTSAPLGADVARGVLVVFREAAEARRDDARAERELAALAWVGRVRDALDEGRLILYSQPVVPLRNGEPGEQLLLRMVRENGTVALPDSFLPIAEQFGLVDEIDRLVVAEAARLAATGRRVEVSLSAQSMATPELLAVIERKFQDAGADPRAVTFDVTPTSLMTDIDDALGFARGLASIGCKTALNDFGTGFGNLNHLKSFRVDYLKIGTEFVRDVVANEVNRRLVAGIVRFAHESGQETIALGIDAPATLELVRELGVDYGQGPVLGEPQPITPVPTRPVTVDSLTLQPADRRVTLGDRAVTLTRLEFAVLEALLTNRGRVLTPDELSQIGWGHPTYGQPGFVNVQLSRVRSKLREVGAGRIVENIHGVGWVIR